MQPAMSTAPARPSHPAAAWVAWVLGVILLYFVSYPVVEWSIICNTDWLGPSWAGALVRAVRTYAAPYEWLQFHTPLRAVLEAYDLWWWHHLPRGLAG
jgi:hypothetical protein